MTLPAATPAPDDPTATADVPAAGTPDTPATVVERRARPRWLVFLGLAAAVVLVDQLLKAWVSGTFQVGQPSSILGDVVRITISHNQGALFGVFQGSAVVLGLVSLAVVALIVWYEAHAGASLLVSLALGLLMGGALGNLTDRLRLGYVVDFVDAGLGAVRWFTFNLADASIDGAILLLVLVAFLPTGRPERSA
jgi:signal peptidase II